MVAAWPGSAWQRVQAVFSCRARGIGIASRLVLSPRTLSVVLATAIGLLPCAPPEHLHETEDANGHHESVVHRHSGSHVAAHTLSDHHDHHKVTVDDEERVIATLDPLFTVVNVYSPAVPAAEVVALVEEPTPENDGAVVPRYIERLIHGPPFRAVGPRAPPLTPLL